MTLINKKIISYSIMFLLIAVIFSSCSLGDAELENTPPGAPLKPIGPDYGVRIENYFFSTNSTDPDGDMIRYGWDFNGNGSVNVWTNFYQSGASVSKSWSWWAAGIYNISVIAEDEHGAQSSFSEPLQILINTPPEKPGQLSGPTGVCTNLDYTYSIGSNDSDGDSLFYMFAWGNSISDWYGPFDPGEYVIINYSWEQKGNYEVSVRCKDIYGSASDWSTPLTVKVSDLLDIKLPIINVGRVKANIINNGQFDLKNVSWNITIHRTRLLRNLNITDNGTIENLEINKINRLSTDKKIVRKLGFVKIKLEINIDELVARPYRKTITTYGFILGRIIFVFPYRFLYITY